jgi:hypothetical protein
LSPHRALLQFATHQALCLSQFRCAQYADVSIPLCSACGCLNSVVFSSFLHPVCSLQSQSPSSDTNHSLHVRSLWLLWRLLPAQVDREFRRNMTMNIDITIAMKCNYLGADYVDVSGETRLDLTLFLFFSACETILSAHQLLLRAC